MRNASAPADDEADDAAGRPERARVPAPRPAPGAVSSGVASSGTESTGGESADSAEIPAPAPPADPVLSEREREILAFEQRWWKHAGAKEQAIRDSFDLSATRYYQILNGLLDNPAALAAEPMLVARLRRLRATRSRNRRR